MSEICVCAEPLHERGKYPCGHELCLLCTLKKRVLMKDPDCPYCRSRADTVFVVSSAATPTDKATLNFQPGDLKVENKKLFGELRHVLSYACPKCDAEHKNYKALKQHIQAEHDLALCDVCTRHEYVFSDEYQLIQPNKIKEHLRSKHIHCKYCNNYHYGSSEFSKHCRQAHIGCGVCERVDPEHPLYFRTYDQLKGHYLEKHYMCMVPACLENKHIVFGTEMELQNHMVEAHRGLLSNVRKAQTVNLERLSLDASSTNTDTNSDARSGSRAVNGSNEADEIVRYRARLELAAGHDKSKIDRLEAANITFMVKNVPVMIFMATYESVLPNTPAPEITALLRAFKKAYRSQLSEKCASTLDFALHQRSQAEEVQSKTNDNTNSKNNAAPAAKKPSGPTPVEIHKYNWGLNVPRSGGIRNVAELPRLGSSNSSTSTSKPPSAPTWKPKVSSSPSPLAFGRNLPKLAKKTPEPGSERQTSIPLRSQPLLSRSLTYTTPTPTASSSSLAPSPPTSSLPTRVHSPSPAPSSSAKPKAAPTGRNGNIRLNNLPTLSKPKPQEVEQAKKKTRPVIRMV